MDFEPALGLKLNQTKPNISCTVPTNRHTAIRNDSGPISACFDDDPKLLDSYAENSPKKSLVFEVAVGDRLASLRVSKIKC